MFFVLCSHENYFEIETNLQNLKIDKFSNGEIFSLFSTIFLFYKKKEYPNVPCHFENLILHNNKHILYILYI